jgi:hypothetical protein
MNLRRLSRALAGFSLLAASIVVTGCEHPPDGAGHPTLEPSAAPAALASVTTAGVTVSFYSVPGPDEQPLMAMSEEGSAYAKSFVVAPLLAQSLTAQEIYLALAGPGAIPPQEMVDAQAEQAAALGRDAAVRTVTIDRDALVEKDLQACQNFLFSGNLSSWVGNSSWVAGPSNANANAGCAQVISFASASPVGIAGCNGDTSTLPLTQGIWPDWNPGGAALQLFTTNINPGWYNAWYWWYAGRAYCTRQGSSCVGDCMSSTPGILGCVGVTLGASYYAFFADSCTASDLVSGIWTPTGPR